MNRETYFQHLPHNQEYFADCSRSPANGMNHDNSGGNIFPGVDLLAMHGDRVLRQDDNKMTKAKIYSLKYPARSTHSADHIKPRSPGIIDGTKTMMEETPPGMGQSWPATRWMTTVGF